jgi:thioester reductase-like protein
MATGSINERDFLVRLLRGCLELGAAPELDAVFHIAPVDFVSSALVRLAADPKALNRSFNLLSSPTGISWKELVERVRDAGQPLCLEPFSAWRRRLADAGPSHPLHAFFPAMDEGVAERGSAVLALFQRAHAPASIDLSALNERLGAHARGMEIDEAYLRPFLERVAGIRP